MLCFVPCSARKSPTGKGPHPLTASVSSKVNLAARSLESGRNEMAEHLNPHSRPMAALEMYTGYFYQPTDLKATARAMVDAGELDLFIISAGYGVAHASETIRQYNATMANQVAALWKRHWLVDAISALCLELEPSEIYGFFSGIPRWGGPGSKYRYFFTAGVLKAMHEGLSPHRAGCFYRLEGMGASPILQGLGKTFLSILKTDDRRTIVDQAKREGIAHDSVLIGYHDFQDTDRSKPRQSNIQQEWASENDSPHASYTPPGPPTAYDFQQAISRMLSRLPSGYIEISSGELHRIVGGYPGRNHRMPICCQVMRENMRPGDEILAQPPKGLGASLRIRYHRPPLGVSTDTCLASQADSDSKPITPTAQSGPQDRAVAATRELHRAFVEGPGVFGKQAGDMPEAIYVQHVEDRYKVNLLTIAAVMDYRTDADKLWRAALATYQDQETRWVFDMEEVAARTVPVLEKALRKHGFTGAHAGNNAGYVHRVCSTFAHKYGGSPHGLLQSHANDAHSLYVSRRNLGDLPYLRGNKIFPFWLRILRDVGQVQFHNIEKIPLPVDVHTARATYRLLYDNCRRPDVESNWSKIAADWFRVCEVLDDPSIYPLALDQPLWLLSRNGCGQTDSISHCRKIRDCVVGKYCIFNS